MRIKTDWLSYLHKVRGRQVALIFKNVPQEGFSCGLELGAGDGYQSSLISQYTKRLICTDYNRFRFCKNESSSFFVCDVEHIDSVLNCKFDLIFSSNLLEHLVDVQATIKGVAKLLSDDGVAIHVLPNVYWKMCNIFFYLPNKILTVVDDLWTQQGLKKIKERIQPTLPLGAGYALPGHEDNFKTERLSRPFLLRHIFPPPHGVSSTNRDEIFAFTKKRWMEEFKNAGFEVVAAKKGPMASGYGFGLDRLRMFFEWMGFSSEYIFIMIKKGADNKTKTSLLI
jgi:SAM-dependent methyltransferase